MIGLLALLLSVPQFYLLAKALNHVSKAIRDLRESTMKVALLKCLEVPLAVLMAVVVNGYILKAVLGGSVYQFTFLIVNAYGPGFLGLAGRAAGSKDDLNGHISWVSLGLYIVISTFCLAFGLYKVIGISIHN